MLNVYLNYTSELQAGVNYMHTGVFQERLQYAYNELDACRKRGGIVWLIGNGGSATLASHMATDLQLGGFRAISLTDITAVSTYANDVNYSSVFEEQLRRLCTSINDCIIVISTSGNSPNVVQVAKWLNTLEGEGPGLISLTGGVDGGRLYKLTQNYSEGISLHFPFNHVGVVQDLQQTALHLLAYEFIDKLTQGDTDGSTK